MLQFDSGGSGMRRFSWGGAVGCEANWGMGVEYFMPVRWWWWCFLASDGGREPLKRRTVAVNHLEAVSGSPKGLLSLDPLSLRFGYSQSPTGSK